MRRALPASCARSVYEDIHPHAYMQRERERGRLIRIESERNSNRGTWVL